MKMATVLLSSDPVSMIRRHSGMISVVRRKLITSELSFLTSAPITPSDVNRRYSNGRDFEVVLRNGYRNSGMWAAKAVSRGRFGASIKIAYRSETVLWSRYAMRHIEAAPGRCILCSKQLQ